MSALGGMGRGQWCVVLTSALVPEICVKQTGAELKCRARTTAVFNRTVSVCSSVMTSRVTDKAVGSWNSPSRSCAERAGWHWLIPQNPFLCNLEACEETSFSLVSLLLCTSDSFRFPQSVNLYGQAHITRAHCKLLTEWDSITHYFFQDQPKFHYSVWISCSFLHMHVYVVCVSRDWYLSQ